MVHLNHQVHRRERTTLKGAEIEDVTWKKENGKFIMEPVPGSRRIIEADLVLLALGFVHPVLDGLVAELDLELNLRKNIKVDNINRDESCQDICRRRLGERCKPRSERYCVREKSCKRY